MHDSWHLDYYPNCIYIVPVIHAIESFTTVIRMIVKLYKAGYATDTASAHSDYPALYGIDAKVSEHAVKQHAHLLRHRMCWVWRIMVCINHLPHGLSTAHRQYLRESHNLCLHTRRNYLNALTSSCDNRLLYILCHHGRSMHFCVCCTIAAKLWHQVERRVGAT